MGYSLSGPSVRFPANHLGPLKQNYFPFTEDFDSQVDNTDNITKISALRDNTIIDTGNYEKDWVIPYIDEMLSKYSIKELGDLRGILEENGRLTSYLRDPSSIEGDDEAQKAIEAGIAKLDKLYDIVTPSNSVTQLFRGIVVREGDLLHDANAKELINVKIEDKGWSCCTVNPRMAYEYTIDDKSYTTKSGNSLDSPLLPKTKRVLFAIKAPKGTKLVPWDWIGSKITKSGYSVRGVGTNFQLTPPRGSALKITKVKDDKHGNRIIFADLIEGDPNGKKATKSRKSTRTK